MAGIRVQEIAKTFGAKKALSDVSLTVQDGEFFSLLGPSGCGKTTLLNVISGFIAADKGQIFIGDKEVTRLEPNKRDVGLVFQSYALFPHMDVAHNIGYGLKLRGASRAAMDKRVEEMLTLVQLQGYGERMPRELSGGQQQRVAIARALALEPSVLLLDEPLSNLDAKLRKQMQFELRRLQQHTGVTTLLVTHDQEEAFSLSDRVAVLGDGVVQQVGTPRELYDAPENRFVADFVGETNVFPIVESEGSESRFTTTLVDDTGQAVVLETDKAGPFQQIFLRPENIQLQIAGQDIAEAAANQALVRVSEVSYTGALIRLRAAFQAGEFITVNLEGERRHQAPGVGDQVLLQWSRDQLIGFGAK